jgi:3-hydroxyacyl-[acyl-carrier-protein] dehydratase
VLEHADIRRILPHRHPILLVDRVLEIEPFKHIVAVKAISGSEPCYAELAEGLPAAAYAFPSSLLIESFAQAGVLLWLHSAALRGERLTGVLIFAAARDCTFHSAALPGDTLRHVVTLDRLVGDNAFLTGQTWAGDRLIASFGSLIGVLRPANGLGMPPVVATQAG